MRSSKIGKVFMWAIMAMAMVGLGGFGVTNLGGSVRTVGTVGDQEISVDDYARALNQQMRQIGQSTGMSVTFEMAQAFGVDQGVLSDLVNRAALDHAGAEIGISISDEALGQAVAAVDAFKKAQGEFDPETYRFQLENAGLTARTFEEDLRGDESRLLLLNILQRVTDRSSEMAEHLVAYDRHIRTIDFKRYTLNDLTVDIASQTQSEISAFYDENTDQFMAPEQKRLTVFWAKVEDFADTDAVDQETVQRLYDSRIDEFNIPEQRFVERIAFIDEAAAAQAMSEITTGAKTFDDIVAQRGLDASDTDLGSVAKSNFDAQTGEAIFAASVDTVVGPFASDFGFALYNVTAISDAQNIKLADVRDELALDIARDRAARAMQSKQQEWDDALAAGATLEDLSQEFIQEIMFSDDFEGPLAGYPEFQEMAALITEDDFPELRILSDDSILAMRLEDVIASAPLPLEDVRDEIATRLRAQNQAQAMTDHGAQMITQLQQDPAAIDDIRSRELVFSEFYGNFPDEFVSRVFQADKDTWYAIAEGDEGYIFQITDIRPADLSTDENAQLVQDYATRLKATYERDVINAFSQAVQIESGVTLNQSAIDAVNAQIQ
ncbi:MAG: SurA N-terminal domain-containing protein [Paracoccaceae bacterium]